MKELLKESLNDRLIRSTVIHAFMVSIIIIICIVLINILNGVYNTIIIGIIMNAVLIYLINILTKDSKEWIFHFL